MRAVLLTAGLLVAACASAGQESPGGGGDDSGGDDSSSGDTDASIPSTCNDVDNDGACQVDDVCPGADDRIDSDNDTVPDGCDQCPGANDTIDANNNQTPDCSEALPLQTKTVPLKNDGTPWRGRHGTLANNVPGNTFIGTASSVGTNNGYLVFSLAGFAPSVVESVTLRTIVVIYADGYGATENVSMWDVTTPAATVHGTTTVSPAIAADLQGGVTYGNATFSPASVDTIVELPLNASAATDVKAKAGQDFVIGFHLDTPDGYVLFSNSTEQRTHELVIKYR